jgi:hypothetical protein
MNLEELVKAYLTLRTARETLATEYDTKDKELKAEMLVLEQSMLGICNDTNANSINTQYGTVIRKMNERFHCNDWDNFKQFVLDNEAVDLLEKRIAQGNFKEFMSERPEDGLPPGVNVMRELTVVVRKPSSR